MPAKRWAVYMVRCRGGALYTGIATDVGRRVAEHGRAGGRGAKSLRGRGPFTIVFTRAVGSRSRALRVENLLKRLPKGRKEELVRQAREGEPARGGLAAAVVSRRRAPAR